MKKSITTLMVIAIIGCASKPTQPSKNMSGVINSHNAAGMILAVYFCQNEGWPNTLADIENYELPYGYSNSLVKSVNWLDFTHLKREYFLSNITLYSREKAPGVPSAVSVHRQPNCEKNRPLNFNNTLKIN